MSNKFEISADCLKCKAKKYLLNHPDIPEDNLNDYLFGVCDIIANFDRSLSSIDLDLEIKNKYAHFFKNKDFSETKKYYNDKLLNQYDKLLTKVNQSSDPLYTALKLAIVTNYIDFSALFTVEENTFDVLMENCESKDLNQKMYQRFKNDLTKANTLMYLSDNCGEIVCDKLLISLIKKQYPHLKITCMVKGGEVLNDASMVDAKQVNLMEVCEVIDNGVIYGGTMLKRMPVDKVNIIKNSDMIIAKGQANCETLIGSGLNIYYLLLCKCNHFEKVFNCKKQDYILANELDFHQ